MRDEWGGTFIKPRPAVAAGFAVINAIPKGDLDMSRTFTLEYWIDEGWYVGRLKGVPGAFSQGKSLQELEENVAEAYRLMVEEEKHASRRRIL